MSGPATVDIMGMARGERADLAEYLATLTPQQWDAPTLCEGWRVRDVVAHAYSYDLLGFGRLAGRMLRCGLSLHRANAVGVAEHADTTPDELVAIARGYIQPRGILSLRGGRIALTDAMIHHQDIRRSLGTRRDIPADRIVAALDMASTAPPLGARKRIAGLTLAATDVSWTAGDGPLVEGPAEALLMVIAGRRGIVSELAGPGVATLAERVEGAAPRA